MTPKESSARAYEICAKGPVIPVLIIERLKDARPLGEALIAGGIHIHEVTLRSEAALDAISEMAGIDGAIIGAGTLLSASQVHAAREAGARFGVSPGSSDEVLKAALECGLPMLPGATTPSEVMALLGAGYDMLKFFPAEAIGGRGLLASYQSPFGAARFCPTGGITPKLAPDYLTLENVICVGGSWIGEKSLIRAGDWDEITRRAKDAAKLGAGT